MSLFAVNQLLELANPLEPELKLDQKYSFFPREVKLSLKGAFFSGDAGRGLGEADQVAAHPKPFVAESNSSASDPAKPLSPTQHKPSTKGGKCAPVAQTSTTPANITLGSEALSEASFGEVLTDLDSFKAPDFSLSEMLIATVPARKPRDLVDPYPNK